MWIEKKPAVFSAGFFVTTLAIIYPDSWWIIVHKAKTDFSPDVGNYAHFCTKMLVFSAFLPVEKFVNNQSHLLDSESCSTKQGVALSIGEFIVPVESAYRA